VTLKPQNLFFSRSFVKKEPEQEPYLKKMPQEGKIEKKHLQNTIAIIILV